MHYYSNSYFLVLATNRSNCVTKLINSRTDLYPSTSTLAITLVHIPRLFVGVPATDPALNIQNVNAVITQNDTLNLNLDPRRPGSQGHLIYAAVIATVKKFSGKEEHFVK